MKDKIVLYLVGLVVVAIAVGLVWLLFGLAERNLTIGTILIFVVMFAVSWIGGRGWDSNNPLINRYKTGFVLFFAFLPGINLIVPYWVGVGIARLTGFTLNLGSSKADPRASGAQGRPLDMILEFMVTNTSEALAAGDYQKAIDTATQNIGICEEQAQRSPSLSAAYDGCLLELYGLRAQARYAQSEETGSAEQLDLAREDAQKAWHLAANQSGTGDEAKLQELKARMSGILSGSRIS